MYIKLQFDNNDYRTVHIYSNQGVDMTVRLKDGSEFTEHYDGKDTLKNLEQFIADVKDQEDGYQGLPLDICLSNQDDFRLDNSTADALANDINEYLAEKYGFCVNAYGWELTVENIDWDIDE